MEREKEVRRLLEDIHKLESIRDKQAVKISSLQDKIHSVDDETNRTLFSSDNAVRTLSNELRFLKGSLEQVNERERRVNINSSCVFFYRCELIKFLSYFSYLIFVL